MALDLSVFYELGLSETEIKLYLILIERGALTAQELVRAATAKRPTVYYALRQLMGKGLVHKTGTQAVERFQAEPPAKLLAVLLWRHQHLQGLERQVKNLIPHLVPSKVAHEGVPHILFYEGDKAMKQAITDTLYCRDQKIDFLTPKNNFFWQADQSFADEYIRERGERGIKTRHLWEALLPPSYMKKLHNTSNIRLLPDTMRGHFRTTTLLYDNTVMYISSAASGYVLTVKSREHYELFKSIYETLWVVSKPVLIKRKKPAM